MVDEVVTQSSRPRLKARRLRVTLVLGGSNSVFPGTNSNTLILTDVRVQAEVKQVAKLATEAQVRVFGMRSADMNALTVAWANPPIVLNHYVVVEALNNGGAWVQVFGGTIIEAQPDYGDMPDVSFVVSAMTGYFQKINPAAPTSYTQGAPIAQIVEDLASKMAGPDGARFTVVDGGTTGVLQDQYLWGSYFDQLKQACAAAKTDFYLFGSQITITPAGKPRTTQPSVRLSPTSGLIGYPQYERAGLYVAAVYDPAFACAVPVEIQCDVPGANGRWYPYTMTHHIDARTPGGNWQTRMQCLRVLQ